jgi:glycosyltransferase involved in cell wall biosynthesis
MFAISAEPSRLMPIAAPRQGRLDFLAMIEINMKLLCVITPCFNEELNLERCYREVKSALEPLRDSFDYVHIFSDNSSTDDSVSLLKAIASVDPRVRVLVNSRNVGPFRNMASALRNIPTNVDLVVPMIPADLQDPPSVIPDMLNRLTGDVSVVYGVRKNRKESLQLKIARRFYYSLLRFLGANAPPANAGEFMLITKEVADFVNANNDEHPYIRGLVAKSGLKHDKVAYDWVERKNGKSRNSWFDLFDQGMNGLIKTTRAPARFTIIVGLLIALGGFGLAFFTVASQALGWGSETRGVPTVLVALSLLGGTQLVFLGVIGEYVLDIHTKLHQAPQVHVSQRINFD